MKEGYYNEEDQFLSRDRKQFRKERRHAQETDRSKHKKSDRDQAKKEEAVLLDDPLLQRGRVTAITGEGIWVDIDHGKLYSHRPQTWNLGRAKATGFVDRKRVNIRNMNPLTIDESRELSRRSKSKFVADGSILCTLKGLMKKEKMLSKNLIAVGDLVRVYPSSESEGTIAWIEERYSTLSRVDVSGKKEQLMAVNIDQVLIVASLLLPHIKPALIDRYLIAAELGHIHPIIVINKIDLLPEASLNEKTIYEEFLSAYEQIGYPIISISTQTGVGLDNLRALMQNKASVFAGQSGVGKSSLLNAAFGFDLKTGDLTQKTFKGCHTTTMAQLLRLPQGGFCIDTPGIRSFGIWALEQSDVDHHFREFHSFAADCRYPDCKHLSEPACAVKDAVDQQKISRVRYESYQSLMNESTGGLDNRTKRKLDL